MKKVVTVALALTVVSGGMLSASVGATSTNVQTSANFASIEKAGSVKPQVLPAVGVAALTGVAAGVGKYVGEKAAAWAHKKYKNRWSTLPLHANQNLEVVFDN
ncbi:hypothetical protein ACT91Q_00375 [Brevibacillus thermoruber]|uniref:hypothetical protein n=1 Tax=Brevibacillus TaxID=55080 RepID=UPI00117E5342|nr:hypothetical protein [Brevibacillus sp. LEMMJ03]TRY27829.1 hypothetical protein FOI68_00235 [Brevibacillus sp. LEMMJ03]